MIRVVVADDHQVVRQGVRAILEKSGNITIVGEAGDGQEAVELVESLKPDVVIMDILMPRLNGIEAIEKIRNLGIVTQIVVFSMSSDTTTVRLALKNGAKAYLVKRSSTDELLLAIQIVLQGKLYLSPAVAELVVKDYLNLSLEKCSVYDQLSSREREVLQLIAEGNTNNAIAQLMKISTRTVEKHRTNIMSKLDIHDTAGLVRTAIKIGLVSLD